MITNPYNLELYPIVSEINKFEFEFVSSFAFARSDSGISLELTTDRRQWNRIDFANFDGYTPPTRNIEFKFGYSSFITYQGGGSNINATEYDFNFSLDKPIIHSYTINLAQGGDIYVYYYDTDQVFAYYGTDCYVELTTDRNKTNNDLESCSDPTGSTVQREIINNLKNPVDSDIIISNERSIDGNLLFRFDDFPICSSEFKPKPINVDVDISLDLIFSDIQIVSGIGSDTNFNLGECDTPTPNFNLGECGAGFIYGKNLNYDIKLCPSESSPAINIDNHNFKFTPEFLGKQCDVLELQCYHGSYTDATIAATILFNDLNSYGGENAESEVSAFKNFSVDIYHGSYGSAIFTDNPATTLVGDAYHGAYGDLELSTLVILQDIVAYHGSYGDLELADNPAQEIPMDAYHGSDSIFELATLPILQVGSSYHGAYGDLDLTAFQSQELDLDAYHGGESDAVLFITPHLSLDTYHGLYSDLDLETFESEGISIVDAYHGSDSVFEFATTTTFESDAYHGIYSTFEFATSTTLEIDGYSGEYGDLDFTLNLADEFDMDAYHGIDAEVDLALTKALFPRAYGGSYSDFDLDDHPAIELSISAYGGSYSDFDLDETEFNIFAYGGSTLEDLDVQVTLNLPLDDIQHGSYVEIDDLKRAPSLDLDVYGGADVYISNFQVPVGESIVASAYSGEVLEPSLSAVISATLTPKPINGATALYDGLGGVGGLNHCYISSADLDPVRSDNVIRLGFDPLGIDDKLNISFDDIGDDPWETCNSGGTKFEVGFQTQPRFSLNCYAGDNVESFLPLELFALVGEDIPLARLYDYEYHAIITQPIFDLDPIEVQCLVEVWDQPDDVVVFAEQYFSAELTTSSTPYREIQAGSNAFADLATVEYAWKTAMGTFNQGQYVEFDFEPVEYTRFCKGYIVPNGNSVVFDFGVDTENYGCSIWIGNSGERSEFELASYFQPDLDTYSGDNAYSTLTVQTLWTLYAYGGQHLFAQLYDEPEFEPVARDGSYVELTFEELPILGRSGETFYIDGFIIPGPGIQWVTETQCLPNEYLPRTSTGDIDVEKIAPDENGVSQYPLVPVEYKEYIYTLDARCITFDQSQSEDN